MTDTIPLSWAKRVRAALTSEVVRPPFLVKAEKTIYRARSVRSDLMKQIDRRSTHSDRFARGYQSERAEPELDELGSSPLHVHPEHEDDRDCAVQASVRPSRMLARKTRTEERAEDRGDGLLNSVHAQERRRTVARATLPLCTRPSVSTFVSLPGRVHRAHRDGTGSSRSERWRCTRACQQRAAR